MLFRRPNYQPDASAYLEPNGEGIITEVHSVSKSTAYLVDQTNVIRVFGSVYQPGRQYAYRRREHARATSSDTQTTS